MLLWSGMAFVVFGQTISGAQTLFPALYAWS